MFGTLFRTKFGILEGMALVIIEGKQLVMNTLCFLAVHIPYDLVFGTFGYSIVRVRS